MPRVSVIIPTYNAETMVSRALRSALAQTITDIEVIVIDDASTDGTAARVLLHSEDDCRIRLLRRSINGGPAAARNSGLEQINGEWIALLDADDMILPERLERMLSAATADDVLIADNLEMYDIHAQRVVKLGIDPRLLGAGLALNSSDFVLRCRTNQPDAVDFGLLKPLIRVSHIRKHQISYDEKIRHAEDFNFYLDVLLAGGRLLVLPEAYYRYTERFGSASGKKSGVSMTQARYDKVEAQTRTLAADPRYAVVQKELNRRADAIHRLVKIAAFTQKSRVAKFASLPSAMSDHVLRENLIALFRAKLSRLHLGPSRHPFSLTIGEEVPAIVIRSIKTTVDASFARILEVRAALLCAMLFVASVLASQPYVDMGLNDDWAYIWAARVLANSGHVVYNGWETTMLGWQLYLGAFFIKVFGFSYFAIRLSVFLVSVWTCILLQRLLIRLGLSEWNSAVATLTLVLSPLFLPLGYSFMTDVPGLFVLILCIYSCARAMQAPTATRSVAWLVFAELSNAFGGSVRQISWLGVLIVVPCTMWLIRRRKGILIYGGLAWIMSLGIIFLLTRWFNNQPYTISEPLLLKSAVMPHYIQPLMVMFRTFLAICLLVVPVLSAFLVCSPRHLRNRRNLMIGIGVGIALVIVITTRHRSVFEALPFGTNYVTARGILMPGILGLPPLIFNTPARLVVMMFVTSSLFCFLGVLADNSRSSEIPVTWTTTHIRTGPTSVQLLLLLGPLTVITVALLVTRSALFDRYFPSVLMLLIIFLVHVYESRVGGRLPRLSLALVLLFALWGIATTHDFYAMNRARLAAADEIRAVGVPRSEIRGGFEYDGVTQLEIMGYINESRIKNPANAYHPIPASEYSGKCSSWFADRTPSVRPTFVLAHDTSCFKPSQFAPIAYKTWLPPRQQQIYIRLIPVEP